MTETWYFLSAPGLPCGPGIRRALSLEPGAGPEAWELLLAAAEAAGFTALWDVSNPNTRSLRESGGTFFVEEIADGLGNMPPLVQSSASAQPTYMEGGFGELDGLSLGGTHDMRCTFGATLSQPNTYVVVARRAGTGAQHIYDGIADGSRNNMWWNNLTNTMRWFAGAGDDIAAAAQDEDIVWRIDFNGSSSNGYRNSALQVSSNAGTNSVTGLTVGARFSLTDRLIGRIGPLAFVDGGPPSSIADFTDLLHSLTGIAKE